MVSFVNVLFFLDPNIYFSFSVCLGCQIPEVLKNPSKPERRIVFPTHSLFLSSKAILTLISGCPFLISFPMRASSY